MSLEFDNFEQAPCATGNESGGEIDPTTCVNKSDDGDDSPTPPSVDDRCADPAFALANPDLCEGYPQLILKPAYALIQGGKTIQYKTYLRARGNEQEITNGLNYSITDYLVAVIEHLGGLATGVDPGIATVSVTWQNLKAYAQIEVVEVCANEVNTFFVLIDNSKSAGVGFSGLYATRLSYAKEAATKFAESVNYSKDRVAVGCFNESGLTILPASNDMATVTSAINSITLTSLKTNLSAGLKTAQDYLNTLAGGHVLMLFSDGENNTGPDPMLLTESWKSQGNIIIVVGLRAWGSFFDTLYRIASPGYFLSVYSGLELSVIETLKAFKNYFCSGDCQPTPGTYPQAALSFTNFTNWDVTDGTVDLIGLGLYDYLPGNGLYVDMAGISPGTLRSKVSFNFVAGHQYRFKINVAGNNVPTIPHNEPVRVFIQTADGLTTLLDETITPDSEVMPFTTYTFLFTPGSSVSAKITITMIANDIPGSGQTHVGPLIDVVVLDDLTASTTLLSDNFDLENQVTVTNYYQYYGPCLSSPPGAQSADPTPVPPIEG